MNKILYHTITFKLPEEQVYKNKKGVLHIAPTLTKTFRVTKRLGLPSIIFKNDEHILHPVIENRGSINPEKNKINFHTITIKVPVDQVYKSTKTGKLLIAPTLTKVNNLTSREKKLSLILEHDAHILHPEISNEGTVETYIKPTRKKAQEKPKLEVPKFEEPILEEPILEEPILEEPIKKTTMKTNIFVKQPEELEEEVEKTEAEEPIKKTTMKTKLFEEESEEQESEKEPEIIHVVIDGEPVNLPEPEVQPIKTETIVNDLYTKIHEFEKIGREKGASHYDSSVFIQSVIYIALLMEYERKCAIMSSDIMDIRINSNDKSTMNKNFFNSAKQLSNDLLDCIKRGEKIIGIPLGLSFGVSTLGHANMLIYRPEQNTIERFEPHGNAYASGHPDDRTFNRILKEMFEVKMKPYLKEYTPTYIPPDQICPNLRGFQTLEGTLQGLKKEGGGFCGLWALFALELMFINPDKTTLEVIKLAYEISDAKPEYLKNVIRGYLVKSEKLIDDYIKKINATDSFDYSNSKEFHSKKNVIQNELLTLLISWKSESSLISELNKKKTIEEEYNNKYDKLIKLLMSKTKQEINKMLIVLIHSQIPQKYTYKEIIDTIIALFGKKKYAGKFTEKKIFQYFGESGGCFKICPKTGKCKIISTCGGIRL